MIYTVGYQSISLEDLARTVGELRVDRIIDVRSAPYSRKPGFNRKRLEAAFGQRYMWRGDILGGRTPIDDQAIAWLRDISVNALLLCMERHPCDCHRYYEIGVRLKTKYNVEAMHLVEGMVVSTTNLKEICDERKEGGGGSGTPSQLSLPES